jgi:hypothetical protein
MTFLCGTAVALPVAIDIEHIFRWLSRACGLQTRYSPRPGTYVDGLGEHRVDLVKRCCKECPIFVARSIRFCCRVVVVAKSFLLGKTRFKCLGSFGGDPLTYTTVHLIHHMAALYPIRPVRCLWSQSEEKENTCIPIRKLSIMRFATCLEDPFTAASPSFQPNIPTKIS